MREAVRDGSFFAPLFHTPLAVFGDSSDIWVVGGKKEGGLFAMAKRRNPTFLPPPAPAARHIRDTITMTTQIDGIDHRRRGRDAATLTYEERY
jgi:hypothetical protein